MIKLRASTRVPKSAHQTIPSRKCNSESTKRWKRWSCTFMIHRIVNGDVTVHMAVTVWLTDQTIYCQDTEIRLTRSIRLVKDIKSALLAQWMYVFLLYTNSDSLSTSDTVVSQLFLNFNFYFIGLRCRCLPLVEALQNERYDRYWYRG